MLSGAAMLICQSRITLNGAGQFNEFICHAVMVQRQSTNRPTVSQDFIQYYNVKKEKLLHILNKQKYSSTVRAL